MLVRARLLRFGPIPPVAGRARTEFLMHRGKVDAKEANRCYRDALDEVQRTIGQVNLPACSGGPYSQESALAHLKEWQRLAVCLAQDGSTDGAVPGERAARKALEHAAQAYFDLAETPLRESAHRRLHRCGELVGGLYGCWMDWDAEESLWFETCVVRLAHIQLGFSPGFTWDAACSICQGDLSECDHEIGMDYPVEVGRYLAEGEERCTACHEAACSHQLGTIASVACRTIMRNAVMHEGTVTPSPREPRARVQAVSLEQEPPRRSPTERRRCVACLAGCGGLMPSLGIEDQ